MLKKINIISYLMPVQPSAPCSPPMDKIMRGTFEPPAGALIRHRRYSPSMFVIPGDIDKLVLS
jgi:hypothetical protein